MIFKKGREENINFNFIPRDKEAELKAPPPRPAKLYYPEYMKKMPHSYKNDQGWEIPGSAVKCMPFMDSFTSGYIQELACDVEIRFDGQTEDGEERVDNISYTWRGDLRPLSTRFEVFNSPNFFPRFYGYYHTEFHWDTFWEPQTPPGYSTLYTHPSNRFDLPFQTMTGIIDTDRWAVNGPLPFLLKYGFEGVIPAGTPIYQIHFIKRNTWKSDIGTFDEQKVIPQIYSVRKTSDGYKKKFWVKKKFY